MTDSELMALAGWRFDIADQEFDRLAGSFLPFIARAARRHDGPPIWEYAKQVNGGRHLPTYFQESGDCVSMGAAQAGMYLSAYEIVARKEEEVFKRWFPPWIYFKSRMAPDAGNGRLRRGAGSTGAWAAVALMNYGVLFDSDPGVPAYSGALANAWGIGRVDGVEKLETLAHDNPVRSASRLRTADEIIGALDGYQPCTYAIIWRYGSDAVERHGRRFLQRQRRATGGHQICLLDYDREVDAVFALNSWGESAHAGPDNGEPLGGAWLDVADVERDLSESQTEVYALSQFDGHPADADWGII